MIILEGGLQFDPYCPHCIALAAQARLLAEDEVDWPAYEAATDIVVRLEND